MEEVSFTDGQFRILLNCTPDPAIYTPRTVSLVGALHRAEPHGHKWLTKLSEGDIETALDLFEAHRDSVRAPGSRQAWAFFVRDSATARRIHDARNTDVPRETSTEET